MVGDGWRSWWSAPSPPAGAPRCGGGGGVLGRLRRPRRGGDARLSGGRGRRSRAGRGGLAAGGLHQQAGSGAHALLAALGLARVSRRSAAATASRSASRTRPSAGDAARGRRQRRQRGDGGRPSQRRARAAAAPACRASSPPGATARWRWRKARPPLRGTSASWCGSRVAWRATSSVRRQQENCPIDGPACSPRSPASSRAAAVVAAGA